MQKRRCLIPHRMPKPRGIPIVSVAFVDSSHAANQVTRRHSDNIIFINQAPVKWLSRRQQTVESSAFSSEFIAMKHCIEDIEHLRFLNYECLEFLFKRIGVRRIFCMIMID